MDSLYSFRYWASDLMRAVSANSLRGLKTRVSWSTDVMSIDLVSSLISSFMEKPSHLRRVTGRVNLEARTSAPDGRLIQECAQKGAGTARPRFERIQTENHWGQAVPTPFLNQPWHRTGAS